MAGNLAVSRTWSVNNPDVASLVRRWDRTLVELTKSVSANVSETMVYDLGRVKQALFMLKSYQAFVTSLPPWDTPESYPVLIKVDCYGTVPPIENDSVWDLAQTVDTAIIELANSQSARLSSNLVPFDSERMAQTITRVEALVAHIETAEPVDYPESAPREANAGQGNIGINYSKAA